MFNNEYILHKGTLNNIYPDHWQKLIYNPNGSGRLINYNNGQTTIRELSVIDTYNYNTESNYILRNMFKPLYQHLHQTRENIKNKTNKDLIIFIIPIILIVLLVIFSNNIKLTYS